MRNFILVLGLFLLPANFLAAEEEIKSNPDFYFEYTQENGTRAFVDSLSKVPAKYRASAKLMGFPDLAEKVAKKTTVSQYKGPTHLLATVAPDVKPVDDECDKPLTFDFIYKQVGDITRVYYRMFDNCGEVVGEFPFQPPYSYMEPKYGQGIR